MKMNITKRSGIRLGEIGHDEECKCVNHTEYMYYILYMLRMLLALPAANSRHRIRAVLD